MVLLLLIAGASSTGGVPAFGAQNAPAEPSAAAAAATTQQAPKPAIMNLDDLARAYVELVLAIGEHDPNYVDAYYGPEPWREQVRGERADLESLAGRAQKLQLILAALPASDGATAAPTPSELELITLRRAYLGSQLRSADARIAMLRGQKSSFDEESQALYDAVAPTHDEAYFQRKLDQIDAALAQLPSSSASAARHGSLAERLEELRRRVTIPPDRVTAVFARAIAECRARTEVWIPLPAGESFTVETVTDKPWSAYNWYQGGLRSVIQVNVSLPILIDRAVDLACHEGYPGHHVYNLLLEQHLVRERGWPEFQVYPLFSPQSLIAEGTANFGIAMAFPGAERLAFERDVLFPLAGLDPELAAPYESIRKLVDELSYAGNEAARRYLDGKVDAAATTAWLVRYALMSPERAAQRIRFFDTYRSYVINYNLGQDLVAAYVDGQARAKFPDTEPTGLARERWRVFRELMSSPRLPSGLVAAPTGGS